MTSVREVYQMILDVSHGEWMYEHFYDRFEHNYNSPIILARWTLKQ